MVNVNKDGHLGCGDHLEYLAIAEEGDSKNDVICAVRKVFIEKFGVCGVFAKCLANRASNGVWTVKVYA